MKTLVTHIRPHLDDICAMWLLVRLVPDLRDSGMRFVPTDAMGGTAKDSEEQICVGVGRGKYDEHKGDVGDCSTTLVWKDVSPGAGLPEDEWKAYKRIVDWALNIDLGNTKGEEGEEFSVPAVLDGFFDSTGRDSEKLTRFGFTVLDSLLEAQRKEVQLAKMWDARTEFMTPWGLGVAAVGAPKQFDGYAYSRGATLVAVMNPEGTYHALRARADSAADFSAAYKSLKEREPEANWYLHHSRRMLICGGTGAVPAEHPSALTLKELADLVALKRQPGV